MPRQSTVLNSKKEQQQPRTKAWRKPRTAGLDALAAAENQYPHKSGVARHRLGDDDSTPKRKRESDRPQSDDTISKRRRTEDEEDEASIESGSDSEGNEWQTGKVDSEDDSEIDSDEALGESDEEKFEGFAFRGSSQPKKTKIVKQMARELDLSEEFDSVSNGEREPDADEDDDFGEDAVDLATAWDMNAEESEEENSKKRSSNKRPKDFDDSVSESEFDDQSVGDDESDLSVSEDEDETKARGLQKLQKFVNALEPSAVGSKSTLKGDISTVGGMPSEYGLMPTRKLTVADLIPTIADSRLKGALKHVDDSTSKKGKFKKLEAPLAKRQQDRIERAAAYEKSKEALNRWIDTVKANRRAEHISFPLPEPNGPQEARIIDSQPRTDLETTIQSILVESGLADSNAEEKLQEFEELQVNKLPLEEIMARRAELRKARELMFREEVRAKRIKKIKSKAYRRVHRKEREREVLKEREALEAAGVDLEDEDRELSERRRAEARMGAKHKESKWAKSLKQTGRTAWDEDARLEMTELARREDELQKRMEGKTVRANHEGFHSSESDDTSDDESDASEGGFGSDNEAKRLSRKLHRLESNGDPNMEASGPHAKLFSLKFMQNAEASRKAANDAEIKRLNRELGGGEESGTDTNINERGRQKFGKQKKQSTEQARPSGAIRGEFEEPESDDEAPRISKSSEDVELPMQKHGGPSSNHPRNQRPILLDPGRKKVDADTVDENPWLSERVSGTRKKKGDVGPLRDIALINPTPRAADLSKSQKIPKKSPAQQRQSKLVDSDDDEEVEENDEPIVLQNEDLVKRAFAGDEVLHDFTKEKRDTIVEEGDKVIDESLPGWGNWTGDGLSKREKKQFKRKLTTVEGIKPEKRKDAKLDRVIINEKRVRKNVKYLASQLPHPFESKQQYERSLRLPIGPEWTTKETFESATKPRVMVKQGIIKPIQKPII